MAGSTPAFADVPAKTWRLLVSSVLDFIIIALVVTTVALWGVAGYVTECSRHDRPDGHVVAVAHAPGNEPRASTPGVALG